MNDKHHNLAAPKLNSPMNNCWNRIGIWGKEIPRCAKLEVYIHCRNCTVYTEAGRQVLERNLTDGYESDWAKVYSQNKQEHIRNKESLTIFRLGDEILAIPTEYIMSINDIGNIHTIPHNDNKVLRGIINLEGELKICISLGRLLGLNKAVNEINEKHRVYNRMVEITYQGKEYIFITSEVLGIHSITEKDYKELPATISQAKGTYSKALIEWKENDIAYLDIGLIFYNLDRNLA